MEATRVFYLAESTGFIEENGVSEYMRRVCSNSLTIIFFLLFRNLNGVAVYTRSRLRPESNLSRPTRSSTFCNRQNLRCIFFESVFFLLLFSPPILSVPQLKSVLNDTLISKHMETIQHSFLGFLKDEKLDGIYIVLRVFFFGKIFLMKQLFELLNYSLTVAWQTCAASTTCCRVSRTACNTPRRPWRST